MIENKFPTVAANWEHFERVDIAPNAPPIQRHEMKRAFLAGFSSGMLLATIAYESNDPIAEISKLNAELAAWLAMQKAKAA